MKWDTKEEATIATMIQQLCECNVAVHLQYVKGHTDIRHSCFIDQLINEKWKKKNYHRLIKLNVATPRIKHKAMKQVKLQKKTEPGNNYGYITNQHQVEI